MRILRARRTLRRSVGLAALLCISASFPSSRWGMQGIGPLSSFAQDGWRTEYDEVCSKIDLAMTLSREELSTMIDRCDKLRPRIELEEESTRKVYLRRLQKCRNLYMFVFEAKEPK